MKNKYNKLYKGLFNQEKKSIININPESLGGSNLKTNDNSEVKAYNEKDNQHKESLSLLKKKNDYQQTQSFSGNGNMNKIKKNIRSENLFLLKRQYINDVFNNDYLDYNGSLFESEISSLFDERMKKENISFMKENITKVKNVSSSLNIEKSLNFNMIKKNKARSPFIEGVDVINQCLEGEFEGEELKIKNNYYKILNN